MTNGTDYRAILASDTPLIDVRAPVEFSQSAMPAAINLPLMNDEERAAVGTCYKRQGPEAALALGWRPNPPPMVSLVTWPLVVLPPSRSPASGSFWPGASRRPSSWDSPT